AAGRGAASGDVSGLSGRLAPAVAADVSKVPALVGRLDAEEFAERERAARELAAFGPAADAALRDALDRTESLEVKARIGRLLKASAAAHRRAGHALEVLEMVGTDGAARILTELAAGAPGASVTREAAAALARVRAR
ncbi:MAG: hypothetical protein ACRC33_01980, partial [Gemmataceae bacterium]